MNSAEETQATWLNHMREGQQEFQRGQIRSAAQAFKKATQTIPQRIDGWINLGSTLLEYQQLGAAERAFENAVKLDPKQMLPHMLLGDANRMLGRPTPALKSYQKAVTLQRTPMSLNKLACALRGKKRYQEAAALYKEAIELAPGFSLAKVNLATQNIETDSLDEAQAQLRELQDSKLPNNEQHELDMANRALPQRQHLGPAILAMTKNQDFSTLETALQTTPYDSTQLDEEIWGKLQRYGASAQQLKVAPVERQSALPDEWPTIESVFTVTAASSFSDYLELRPQLVSTPLQDDNLSQSLQLAKAITAARAAREQLANPYAIEVQLRYWHSLSTQGEQGILPGHFKYTQFGDPNNPLLRRAEPALSGATLRHFIGDIYQTVEPGYARAATALMAMSDIHPFADGNTRTALTWMNRELEWAGMVPALFPLESGLRASYQNALAQVRRKDGDLAPLVAAIQEGQQFTLSFLRELEAN